MSNFRDLLPTSFSENKVLVALMDSLEIITQEFVGQYIDLLKQIRNPATLERELKLFTCAMLGFKFNPGLFGNDSLERILGTFAQYRQYAGTPGFSDYLGFVDDTEYEVIQMWSEDYVTFHATPGGGTIYDGTGPWYLTPHIKLTYTSGAFKPIFDKVEELFYYFAPVHLVLEEVIKSVKETIPIPLGIGGVEVIVLTNF